MIMPKYTLQQISAWHRTRAEDIRNGITSGNAPTHERLADSIDAHLAKEYAPTPQDSQIRDAARYRWLRDVGVNDNGWHVQQELPNGLEEIHIFPDRLDQSIDIEMAKEPRT